MRALLLVFLACLCAVRADPWLVVPIERAKALMGKMSDVVTEQVYDIGTAVATATGYAQSTVIATDAHNASRARADPLRVHVGTPLLQRAAQEVVALHGIQRWLVGVPDRVDPPRQLLEADVVGAEDVPERDAQGCGAGSQTAVGPGLHAQFLLTRAQLVRMLDL